MKNTKLMDLEARIYKLEKELQDLKEEAEILRAAEVTDTNTIEIVSAAEVKTNCDFDEDVLAIPVENLGFSVRAVNCLKRGGIDTLGMLAVMSEEELCKCSYMGRKSFLEITEKLKSLRLDPEMIELKKTIEGRMIKEEQERKLSLELSKNFLVALEVYAKFEEKADMEGIKLFLLNGIFHYAFRMFGNRDSYTVIKEFINEPILNIGYCNECINGEHPKMFALLKADEVSMDMIKEAVLEDLVESNTNLNKRSKSYYYAARFIEIVKNFEK